ncbi:hypothetical protein [Sphingopyxis macrogoltabida]|uniref:Uncharacterized protein n=1 Tax=Sphingopyxis macrogoltabida TaxID=33050 RepID=A0A0N9UY29_SPHMC|nr:hypothetical protein [Sphingopyxis macrogoltabida]ALH80423.1 hypothetical protein AN936_08590 [Sphingopyxis macrogoltabida]
MNQTLLDALQYYGAAAATLAALLVSLNLGERWTGGAFVIFVTSSLALIAWGFLQPDSEGIGWQNVALLGINLVGVYSHLIRKKPAGKQASDD